MADPKQKSPLNAPGRFYVDSSCIECLACVDAAPEFYVHDFDRGASYLKRQPATEDEIARCREGLEACPTGSIGDDG
ncbi:MAG: ferredoxin [Planctomycetota bacterium]